jgi:LPXTG-motif cell wall-anchored protein
MDNPVLPIPTLDEIGLAVAALLLAGTALIYLLRRRRAKTTTADPSPGIDMP